MESEVSVIEGPVEPAPPPKGKKVRLACQRCRDRRIKCDGQMPSCSKCAKAGVRCIDVDARRAGISIPRAFLPDAQARLEWLEDVVKTQLPDFDLSAGPQIPDNAGEEIRVHSRHSSTVPVGAQDDSAGPSIGTKRDFAQSVNGTYASIPKRARRMTADLGLFSLNPNGVQPQYLGSSSGSFFADLLLDAGPEYTSDPDTEGPEDLLEDSHSAEHSVRALLKSLKDTLPPREECDRMVKGFFSFYHADYPVLHQPSFLGLVEALYASAEAPDDCSLQHHGWPVGVRTFEYNDDLSYTERQQGDIPISLATGIAHLFFVLSIAAELRSRKRRFAMDPKPFASQAIACLQKSVAEVLLSSVQSMILYVLHSFLSAEGARTWIMLHVAMSYAIDMGLQRDQPEPSNFSSTMLQMRRRVFLTIYTLERYISTIQGRPLGFEDHSLDMTMPTVSTGPFINDSALADQAYLPYSITHFKWASIISEFKHRFYRLLPGDGSTASIQEMQQHLHDKLKGWLDEGLASVESLPTVHQARFKTKLKIDYHFATGLLYQPSRSCPRPSPQALGFCFESAKQRIRLFDSLYYQNNSSLSWPRTHGVFLAGATFVYCIWASSEIRTTASPAEVAGDLRLCSSLLALGGEWWPLAQRGKKSFERLADATLQALFSSAPSTLPDVQLAPSLDLASLPRIDSEWLDPEAMLQSFFQTDLQFPELFGPFDTSMFDTPDFYTDAPGCTDGINALLE